MRQVVVVAVVGCVFGAFGASATPASANVHTWTGPSGGTWSNAANWSGGVPTSGEAGGTTVKFGTNTTSTMDIVGLTVDQLWLSGTGNTINGLAGRTLFVNGSAAQNNIRSDGTGNTLAASLPLGLTGAVTIFIQSTSGTLNIAGTISGTTNLRFFGLAATDGTRLTGQITIPGTTFVSSGTLLLDNNGVNAAITGPNVVVGDSVTEATLRLAQHSEIADTTDVRVTANSTFDVAGHYDVIDALTIEQGLVSLGAGRLTTEGTLNMTGGSVTGSTSPPNPGLAIKGDVVATSTATSSASVTAPVTITGARQFTIADGPAAEDLRIGNVVTEAVAGASLRKDGPGTLWLNPSSSNVWTGGTTIADGTLKTLATSGRTIPVNGSVTVGDDAGAAGSAVLLFGINNDIDQTTALDVRADGRVAGNGTNQTVKSLTMHDGSVDLPPNAANNLTVIDQVTMTGGVVDGVASLRAKTFAVTSSAAGPARILAPIRMATSGSGLFTVTPGPVSPELEATGGLTPVSGFPGGFAKAGGGTMVLGGVNTLPGAVDVQAGILAMNGTQTTPITVGPLATLTGNGTVGGTTVTGTLAPSAPAFRTGTLALTATSRLRIDGPPSADLPRVETAGAVTIGAGALLDLQLASGPIPPTATQLPLIVNGAGEGVLGQFANAPEGSTFTGAGLPFTVGYAAGDGNDVTLTAANVAPVVTVSPPDLIVHSVTGKAVALSASATDANQDPLTFTWDLGDGTTASGPDVSHAYAKAGTYTATVTVSDGRASVSASRAIAVTAPQVSPPPPDTRKPKLTFSLAKRQKPSSKGTFAAKLTCDEACTVTLATAVKPPGRKAKTGKATTMVTLAAGKATTVKITVPKAARKAVLKAVKARRSVTVRVAAKARDAAGNASASITRKTVLKR